jgi:hypothetical protein
MALTGSGASTVEQVRSFLSQGDHDIFAHYVTKEDSLKAAVEGAPIVALCGKVWVPYRNPDSYPVCPTCSEIAKEVFGE